MTLDDLEGHSPVAGLIKCNSTNILRQFARFQLLRSVADRSGPQKVIMHFAQVANTLLKDEESARDNHVLACNFAKYLPILKTILPTNSATNLS